MRGFALAVALLLAAVAPSRAQLNASETWATVSGTNTLTATIGGIAAQADLLGVPIRFIPPNSNTGATTFNPNAIGAVAVKKPTRGGLVALTGGEIQTTQEAQFLWDGTEYICTTCTNTYKLPTVQVLTSGSAATYTTSIGATRLEIQMIAGGGGGNSGASGNTIFGSTTAVGGSNSSTTTGGAGGSGGTTGTGTVVRRVTGGNGGWGQSIVQGSSPPTTGNLIGGNGCSSPFGQGGISEASAAAFPPVANLGSGGAGIGLTFLSSSGPYNAVGGGGCGEYVEFFINAPAATYTYTVGVAGGSSTSIGSTGVIVVKEYYN